MKAIFNIPYGLYVVTAKDEKYNGCVINTLQQVTSTPAQISITINKDNHTTKMIEKTKKFNVSILDKTTDFDLIKTFGFSSGKESNTIYHKKHKLLYFCKSCLFIWCWHTHHICCRNWRRCCLKWKRNIDLFLLSSKHKTKARNNKQKITCLQNLWICFWWWQYARWLCMPTLQTRKRIFWRKIKPTTVGFYFLYNSFVLEHILSWLKI